MMAERRGEPYFGKGVDPFKDGIQTKKKNQLGVGSPNRARRRYEVARSEATSCEYDTSARTLAALVALV